MKGSYSTTQALRGLIAAAVLAGGWLTITAQQPLENATDSAAFSPRTQLIAASCATCHGTAGRLATAIPALARRPETQLRAHLLAFKRDEAQGATVMPRLAKGFSDEMLIELARYFASLEEE